MDTASSGHHTSQLLLVRGHLNSNRDFKRQTVELVNILEASLNLFRIFKDNILDSKSWRQRKGYKLEAKATLIMDVLSRNFS